MSAARTLGPRIAVLKEGSEKALGPEHIASNAKACSTIAEILKSTLGPAGQDIFIARESNFWLFDNINSMFYIKMFVINIKKGISYLKSLKTELLRSFNTI